LKSKAEVTEIRSRIKDKFTIEQREKEFKKILFKMDGKNE